MYIQLTLQERLKDLRMEHGLTLEALSAKTGLSKSALGQYESNDNKDISHTAVVTLAKFYGVSTDYLLGMTENKNHPNTELDSLHLSDDMVDLLRSGRLNNRLLCELAVHPGFRQFLLDMEICVDRIADMHIHNLNQGLESARQQVIEKYAPAEDDVYLRTLEVAQVETESYFTRLLYDDLTAIVKDLREAHKSDTTTADEQPDRNEVAQEVAEMVKRTAELEATPDRKRAYLCCEMMKVEFFALTEEQQTAMEQICKRSPIFDTPISQRGKAKPPRKHSKKKR